MNKQYMVDKKGNVTIIKDSGEIINGDSYTNVTDSMLYLENIIESLGNQINHFSKKISELNNSIKHKLKIIRYINISLILLIFTMLIFGIATYSKICLIVVALSIPLASVIKKIENNTINKEKTQRNIYKQKVKEKEIQINKINKRMLFLSKGQQNIIIEHINKPIEIKSIENYVIDPSDYFVELYLIEKRTEEMTKNKPKIKKKTKQKYKFEYEL